MIYARILVMKNENFSYILKIKILTCKGYPDLKKTILQSLFSSLLPKNFRGRLRGWEGGGVTGVTSQPPPYNDLTKLCPF